MLMLLKAVACCEPLYRETPSKHFNNAFLNVHALNVLKYVIDGYNISHMTVIYIWEYDIENISLKDGYVVKLLKLKK